MKRQITLNARSLRSARFSTSPQAAKAVLHKTYLRPRARLIPIVHLRPPTPLPPDRKTATSSLKFKGKKVIPSDAQQVLDYLNQVQDIDLLIQGPSVGSLVAKRIFERKKRYNTLSSINQLEDIAGFGPVKFKEILDSAKA